MNTEKTMTQNYLTTLNKREDNFERLRAHLVGHFKQPFEHFKHTYTHFHIFFSLTRISKTLKQYYSNSFTKHSLKIHLDTAYFAEIEN